MATVLLINMRSRSSQNWLRYNFSNCVSYSNLSMSNQEFNRVVALVSYEMRSLGSHQGFDEIIEAPSLVLFHHGWSSSESLDKM
jgi:hypothetical protein